jgi:pimeloyl-ACP methyl ester carboxylesterase
METKTLQLSNADLTYVDEGNGEPIMLLHGFCGSSGYWEKVIPALSKKYRVLAPDLPGHGGSAAVDDADSIEVLADYMKRFLDGLKLDQVTLFGHSLGGYITLAFAEKYAKRLNGFSLVHSTAFPDGEEAKKGRDANIEKVNNEGISALIDGLVPKLFSPDNLERNAADIAAAIQIGYLTAPNGAISALKAMKERQDRNHVLKDTSLPVLLIAGEKDQVIPVEKTFSMSRENIKHTIIKGSGHMSMYENTQTLVKELELFLAR